LGLLYLGASLKRAGYDVDIVDSPFEGYTNLRPEGEYITYGLSDQAFKKRIKTLNLDIVGVTSMFTAQQKIALYHCDLIKQVKDVPVILGGIHPSLDPINSVKHPSVDYVVIGEGEYRLPHLVESIENGREPALDGIASKKRIIPMTQRITDLDALAPADRSLINMDEYIRIGIPMAPFSLKDRVAEVMTSRGCPYHCNFCSTVNYWGRHFRTRSVDNVIDEITGLKRNYGIEEIQFIDDNITANPARAKEIFKRMNGLNLSFCTPHGLKIDTLDKEMINLMADAGAYQLTFAVESGSQRVLKEIIHKHIPEQRKVKDLIDICHERDINVHGLFIVGFPGETREEIKQTLAYPAQVGFDSVSFFIANPVFGSDLYKECKDKGYLDERDNLDLKHAIINIPQGSPDYNISQHEIEELTTKAYASFSQNSVDKKRYERFKAKHPELNLGARLT